jgi:hypothetical protein
MRIQTKITFGAVAVALLATSTITAQAASRNSAHRRGGVIPAHTANPRFPGASNALLDYHGGPVMRTNSTFTIYWSPRDSTWQGGYMDAVDRYFADVAADSGSTDNVYSTETQYFDTTGSIAYRSTFADSYIDRHAFPANGCPAYGGYAVCLTDAQIIAEVHRVTDQLGLPEDGTHAYFLLMPKDVGSCFDAAGTVCAFTYYCAYHSYDGSLLYASIPYAATLPAACGLSGPNGTDAESTINTASHEHREMINDPHLNAWFDNKGYEGSDKCAWTFGSTLATSTGSYNQTINGHQYLLQQEWSNASRSCVQSGS